MINAETIPVDVEEMRSWAAAHKETQSLSWAQFAEASGIKAGTLQPFVTGIYKGDNAAIARNMAKYRQMLDNQAPLVAALPSDPGFFLTPSARQIRTLLQVAHTGRITLAATGPGIGKTTTAEEYVDGVSSAWLVTMTPATCDPSSMLIEILEALGKPKSRGTPQNLYRQVRDALAGRKALLVIDEAHNLSTKSLELLRSLNDRAGGNIGICLLGNEELTIRLEVGKQSDAFGRLNSRIANRVATSVPMIGDVIAFCDAWGILEPAQRKYLTVIATTGSRGGLRDCFLTIESASFIAADEGRGLTVEDLKEAHAQRYIKRLVA